MTAGRVDTPHVQALGLQQVQLRKHTGTQNPISERSNKCLDIAGMRACAYARIVSFHRLDMYY